MLDLTPAEAFAHTHNGGYVLESLPAALWAFLANRENPEEAIVAAVNGGYDADTIGVMAGALAGAYHGETGLPGRWIDELEGAAHIRSLANRLHRRYVALPTAPIGNPTAGSASDAVFMTPYEYQAAHAEVVNRWVHRAPASMRWGPRVQEIRNDQASKAGERRARIFAEHEWVEVPNAHPVSDQGLATQPVEIGFSATSSNEMFPESRRIHRP